MPELVESYSLEVGRPFMEQDVQGSIELWQEAEKFVKRYTGSFPFIISLQQSQRQRGYLTPAQAKGALNTLIGEIKRKKLAEAKTTAIPVMAVAIEQVIPNGYYTIEMDDSYVVIRLSEGFENKPGSQIAGFLYGPNNTAQYKSFATVFGIDFQAWSTNEEGYEKQQKALQILLHSSKDEIMGHGKAYGLMSGKCFVCNRTLTTPESKMMGLGPICLQNMEG